MRGEPLQQGEVRYRGRILAQRAVSPPELISNL